MCDSLAARLSGAAEAIHEGIWTACRSSSPHNSAGSSRHGCEDEEEAAKASAASSANLPLHDAKAAVPAAPWGESSGETGLFTVYVPTMFTTAGGRPICLREERRLPMDSAYMRFLTQPSGSNQPRAQFLAGQRSSSSTKRARQEEEVEQDGGEDEEESDTEGDAASPWWVWSASNASDAVALVGGGRAQSCPSTTSPSPPTGSGTEAPPTRAETPAPINLLGVYTGFTRANGQPLFHQRQPPCAAALP